MPSDHAGLAGARKYAGEPFLRHQILAASGSLSAHPYRHAPGSRAESAVCMAAIRSGFSSVMMDGSLEADGKTTSSYEYNVESHVKWPSSRTPSASRSKAELGVLGCWKPCRATRKTATARTAT